MSEIHKAFDALHERVSTLKEERRRLTAENERLREALERIKDLGNWTECHVPDQHASLTGVVLRSVAWVDPGESPIEIATQALEGVSDATEK